MNTVNAGDLTLDHIGREVSVPLVGDYGHESATGTLDTYEWLTILGVKRLVHVRVSGTVYALRPTDEVILL